ncbi:MAG: DEAD/DEAH box helicase [Phycisphaerae bacterium]
MDAQGFIERLKVGRDYRGQIAAVRCVDARPAAYRTPASPIPVRLRALLRNEDIEQLYAHQAEAYDAVRRGENVVVCTGTASGKSLCFHLPVLAELLQNRESRALYLFPAKALAYDQVGNLERMVTAGGLQDTVRPACYDGDTPTHKRAGIRRSATILLSNPDMLHVSILPYHAKWAGFLARLEYVVLDEIHTYRGIFGSHVAGVIRRLQRLCRHYGSSPQFICCSATLGNPQELAERLTNRPMRLIDRDGSPQGRKYVVLWNPPWLGGARVARRSGNVEAQELMEKLVEAGAGTISFAKARVVAELIYKYLVEALARRRPDLARRVRPYRGGYLPLERREIEQALFSGELLGVCSTNALELGIDVGSLDAAIIVGFPGTLCSLWQQAGRAGRRQDESLAVFVAYDDPIDQYLVRHPDFVFGRPVEQAIIDPQNPHILKSQLQCAARELAIHAEDLEQFGAIALDVARELEADHLLSETAGQFHYSQSGLPHHETNLRHISNATYAIVDITDGRNAVLGHVDSTSAPELVYPEAVYLHGGESYVVRELDEQAKIARVERLDADYYTQPLLHSDIRVTERRLEEDFHGGRKAFGDAIVKWQTVGFRKFKFYTMELIGRTALELPPQQIKTTAMWLQPPRDVLKAVADAGHKKYEALAGVRNLLLVALPPLAMADRRDLGGIVDSAQLGEPTIFLYDRYEGGVGYARHGYECADELLRMAYALVSGCECDDGCPGCVGLANLRPPLHHDPDGYRAYEFPDKAATMALLAAWLAS